MKERLLFANSTTGIPAVAEPPANGPFRTQTAYSYMTGRRPQAKGSLHHLVSVPTNVQRIDQYKTRVPPLSEGGFRLRRRPEI